MFYATLIITLTKTGVKTSIAASMLSKLDDKDKNVNTEILIRNVLGTAFAGRLVFLYLIF